MSSLLGTSADWYLMRASGFVALALLTVTLGLGVAGVTRLARKASTRAVLTLVHRNASLLATVFVAVHVLTAISDRYVRVPALAVVVPGLSGYDPLWVGLGAAALDLTVAVVVTSLLRARVGRRVWRLVHWGAYALWPSALVHGIGAGTGSGADTGTAWSTVIYLACAAAALTAVAVRLAHRGRQAPRPPAGRPAPAPRPRDLQPVG